MAEPINKYQAGAANWRAILRKNKRRTRFVIAIFVCIYLLLGFLINLYLLSNQYPQVSLSVLAHALVTFRVFPWVMLITGCIALISLWIAFVFHDKLMLLGTEYREITAQNAKDVKEKQLYNIVEEMKVAAGLRYMPKIFIIDADYMNAFASGYSEKSAMVAITQGLLTKLTRDETQAVMAHELSHIRHLDIKVTLMASVLANLMVIMIDILFWGALFGRGGRSNRESGGGSWLFLIIIILRYLLPLITVLLMLFLSRTREYMADAGCVELTRDNEPLARALLKIHGDHQANREQYSRAYRETPHESVRREAYIFDPLKAGIESKSAMSDFFSTHPSIQNRLEALGFKQKKH